MIKAGFSIIEITPPSGLYMAGYAARNSPANGKKDSLTVRAIVVEKTALVVADVIGIDSEMSAKVRKKSILPDQAITITATHTHGGPTSMKDRLNSEVNFKFYNKLEKALTDSIKIAYENRTYVKLYGGLGIEPGVAKNRRKTTGLIDKGVPIIRFDDLKGNTIAFLISYACHPVVLGANNLLWTSDYIHFCRKKLEEIYPKAKVVFATGCAGDVNTGHSAESSLSNDFKSNRTFSEAKKVGNKIAKSVHNTKLKLLGNNCGSSETFTKLSFAQTEVEKPKVLIQKWLNELKKNPSKNHILKIWINWAENIMGKKNSPKLFRSTGLYWGGASIISLPGEIFAESALSIRNILKCPDTLFILGYADDNPGYIPPLSEFKFGGYEIEEAHRFYGLGATFAPGSAELLEKSGRLVFYSARINSTKSN